MPVAGAVESSVTSIVVSLVFGGVQASAAVAVTEKSPAAAAVQAKVLDTNGPPAGVPTVSAAWVQPLPRDERVGGRAGAGAGVGDRARERE